MSGTTITMTTNEIVDKKMSAALAGSLPGMDSDMRKENYTEG